MNQYHPWISKNCRTIGAVVNWFFQEPVLFDMSIAENIAYSKPDATFAEIEAAAMQANAHEFVMKLPDGYRTRVGERGSRLSMGEKQRIAIGERVRWTWFDFLSAS